MDRRVRRRLDPGREADGPPGCGDGRTGPPCTNCAANVFMPQSGTRRVRPDTAGGHRRTPTAAAWVDGVGGQAAWRSRWRLHEHGAAAGAGPPAVHALPSGAAGRRLRDARPFGRTPRMAPSAKTVIGVDEAGCTPRRSAPRSRPVAPRRSRARERRSARGISTPATARSRPGRARRPPERLRPRARAGRGDAGAGTTVHGR